MKTYFVRHSSKLDIDTKTRNKLWDNDLIAIHYPWEKRGKSKRDSKSLNPNDYKGVAKSSIKTLKELAENGGYVFSVFHGYDGAKIGFVKPKTKIRLLKGKWGTRYSEREAILKVIKLSMTKNLSPEDSISLKSVQPRQLTICVWNKVESRVNRLVENKMAQKTLSDLSTDQQEVMCMEFMRLSVVRTVGLPQIKTTLTPVGRTMEDVDIYALANDQKIIFCQVTYANFHSKKVVNKLKILKSYFSKSKNTVSVLFCNIERKKTIDGVIVYPLNEVFNSYCKKTEFGKLWLKKIK